MQRSAAVRAQVFYQTIKKQWAGRLQALFCCLMIIVGVVIPPASAYAAEHVPDLPRAPHASTPARHQNTNEAKLPRTNSGSE